MGNNPLSGAAYLLRGAVLVGRPGVRRYVIVPLLINVILFSALVYLGADWLDTVLDGLLPQWLEWLRYLVLPLFLVAALVVGFFAFNLVANLVAAPFNGLLAEAVERELTGREPLAGGWRRLLADLGLTLASELRKLGYIAVRALPLLVLLVIPGVNVLGSLAWMLFSAWMLAISYLDYPMANHGLGFAEQRRRAGERRWLALGFGAAVMAALAVPVLNFVVIPCAVAGATALWVERFAPAEAARETA